MLVPLAARVTLGDDGTGRLTRVMLDGADATDDVHTDAVDASVSTVSQRSRGPSRPPRAPARARGRRRDRGRGRDIGTVVLPDAELKVFLDASVDERADRRIAERGLDPDGDEARHVREQLRARDHQDRNRAVAPLRAADDAPLRTDGNTFDQTVGLVVAAIAGVMLTPRPRTRARKSPVAAAAVVAAPVAEVEAARAAEVAEVPELEPTPPPKPKRTRAPKAAAAAAAVAVEAQARAQAEGGARA